jgi:HmuY protein
MTGRFLILVGLAGAVIGAAFVFFVAPALMSRVEVPYSFSRVDPKPVLEPWVEGQVTVDARSRTDWVAYDFSRGSVVTDARIDAPSWDIAFQRYRVRSNGGTTNPHGDAGAIRYEGKAPDTAPEGGYEVDEWEGYGYDQISHNRTFRRWYRYSPLASGLVPRDYEYVIKTADHGYVRFRFVSYDCPAAAGGGQGCVTFQYGYRSDFSRRLGP